MTTLVQDNLPPPTGVLLHPAPRHPNPPCMLLCCLRLHPHSHHRHQLAHDLLVQDQHLLHVACRRRRLCPFCCYSSDNGSSQAGRKGAVSCAHSIHHACHLQQRHRYHCLDVLLLAGVLLSAASSALAARPPHPHPPPRSPLPPLPLPPHELWPDNTGVDRLGEI